MITKLFGDCSLSQNEKYLHWVIAYWLLYAFFWLYKLRLNLGTHILRISELLVLKLSKFYLVWVWLFGNTSPWWGRCLRNIYILIVMAVLIERCLIVKIIVPKASHLSHLLELLFHHHRHLVWICIRGLLQLILILRSNMFNLMMKITEKVFCSKPFKNKILTFSMNRKVPWNLTRGACMRNNFKNIIIKVARLA